MKYLIKTARLGLRNWEAKDIDPMVSINQDTEVMRYFPSLAEPEKTRQFIKRMQAQFQESAYCYFAVDRLDHQEFIGFIGLSRQDFESPYTPATDIGWRLQKSAWNHGFATEGAIACLDYAFETIGLQKIISIAPAINLPSQNVMTKIGMRKIGTFEHPKLSKHPKLQNCVVFEKRKEK